MMVETILDAAARILERQGAAAFTTNRIAEVAGVSVGTFYQYFPNKSAVVEALLERHFMEMKAVIETAKATVLDEPLEVKLRILISAAVSIHFTRPELQRELDRLRQSDDLEAEQAREDAAHLNTIQLIERHRDELAIDDVPLAVAILRTAVKAILHQAVAQRIAISPERLTEELMVLCMGYLTVRSP